MKTLKKLLLFVVASALLAGCTSYKNVPYMQNPEVVNSYREDLPLYDAKIMPKDLLSITVNTSDPQAAAPFNLTVQTPLNAALTNINTTTQPTLQQYLVNNKGEIDFPVIGRLKVGGLTKNEAEDLIREQLQPYLKESPIVTVRMANYKISVLGEVNRPGTFTVGNEKVNSLQIVRAHNPWHEVVELPPEWEQYRKQSINVLVLSEEGKVEISYYHFGFKSWGATFAPIGWTYLPEVKP